MCTIPINKKCDRGYTENIKVGKVAQFLCKIDRDVQNAM